MTRFSSLAATATLSLALFALPATAASDKMELLRDADHVVQNLKTDPAFATAERMIDQARAVYIVPKLVKGGFIFGASGGDGVLVPRTRGGGWGRPSFYGMGSASFGLQAGLEQTELVFIIMSRHALSGIEHGNFKLGAAAGVTVVNLSSGVQGATTLHGGDIVVWSSGTGAYGGLTFDGSVIAPDKTYNATPTVGPEAERLRADLASITHS
jgi:SH3 domain-containing YSC84-like protein 1